MPQYTLLTFAPQPCTKREFLNYLKYIEMAPENLQFFLWYKDYEKRFNEASGADRALAPEWTEAHAEAERRNYRTQLKTPKATNEAVKEILKGTDFEEENNMPVVVTNADATLFDTQSIVASSYNAQRGTIASQDGSFAPTTGMASLASNHTQVTAEAFDEAGMKQPCMCMRNS
jgi:hypothetical protein